MLNSLFNLKDQFLWMLVIIIGFPLFTIILGEITLKLRREKRHLYIPLDNLRNLVLPTLTLFLLLSKVIDLSRDIISVRLAETLLWIAIIYTSLSFLNVVLFENAPQESWQANTPRLFRDLSRFFLILIGTAIVLSHVWGADLAGLITAFGLGSLVIGLALQSNLSNIFSGIALLFEKPFKVGDWLDIDKTIGKVIEMNWRSVHLQTKENNIVIVPNSKISGETIKNLNRPLSTYELQLELGFSFDDPPNKVKQIITQTALETEGVLPEPPPLVLTKDYGDFTINYQILLNIKDYGENLKVRDKFMTRIWYVAKRYNLHIPYPINAEYEYQVSVPNPEILTQKAKETLINIPSINQFGSEMLNTLSKEGTWLDFAKGEVVLLEGAPLIGLYLIIEGSVEGFVTDKMGQQQVIFKLEQGEFFGEKSSLIPSQPSDFSVLAIKDLQLLLLNKNSLQTLLELSPRLSQEIGEIMELRRRAVNSVLSI